MEHYQASGPRLEDLALDAHVYRSCRRDLLSIDFHTHHHSGFGNMVDSSELVTQYSSLCLGVLYYFAHGLLLGSDGEERVLLDVLESDQCRRIYIIHYGASISTSQSKI
jgi:hypothetical protein